MKQLITYIVIILMVSSGSLFGQDARFSQNFNNPLNLNPALAGNGIEYIRLSAIYRNQWTGLGTPFTTQGFGIDKVVSRVGIGGYINRHGAGDGGIRTIQAGGNLSYNLPVGYHKEHTITAGVQLGLINKSFDESKLTFDNQYTPDIGYDPNIASGEYFADNSLTRADISVGLMWQKGWGMKDIPFKPYLGVAFAHINKPKEIFIEEQVIHPIKMTIHGGAGFALNEQVEIKPSFMYLQQEAFNEASFGVMASYTLENNNSVQLGVYDRINDAIIAYAGYQLNQLMFGFSYDINTSAISKAGQGFNAFELSLVYSPKPKKKKTPKEIDDLVEDLKPIKVDDINNVESLSTGLVPMSGSTLPELATSPSTIIVQTEETLPAEPESAITKIENVPVETIETPENTPVELATEPAVQITATAPIIKEVVIDSDGDGIADKDDECPFMSGSKSTRGCPDADNDGIVDTMDDCPMDAGPIANNGCPDPTETMADNTGQSTIRTYNNILFDTGKAKLRTNDIFDIIERAIDLMYANPNANVILTGHTDSEGDAMSNMILSESRTNMVRDYMIKQGVDESRISTISYGENMPLEKNATDEGRQQNRRVEINIVNK